MRKAISIILSSVIMFTVMGVINFSLTEASPRQRIMLASYGHKGRNFFSTIGNTGPAMYTEDDAGILAPLMKLLSAELINNQNLSLVSEPKDEVRYFKERLQMKSSAELNDFATGQALAPARLGVVCRVKITSRSSNSETFGNMTNTNYHTEFRIIINIVDMSTGQVLATLVPKGSAEGSSSPKEAAGAVVGQVVEWVDKVVSGTEWTGTVVGNKDGNVYIDSGIREGIVSGQVFTVMKRSAVINPATGQIANLVASEVARIKVIKAEDKLAVCSVESGDSNIIKPGMLIQLPN